MWKSLGTLIILVAWVSLNGCVGLNTFPMNAKAGDTITIGVGLGYLHGGDPERITKDNTTVYIYDGGAVNYALTPRAAFNLFPDARSNVANYNSWLTTATIGGRPLETVVVVDLPTDIPVANNYTVEVVTTEAGSLQPFKANLNIIGTGGSPNNFQDEYGIPWSLTELENCPYAEVTFDAAAPLTLGAAEVAIGFNGNVNEADIRVMQSRINMLPTDKGSRLFWKIEPGANTVNVYIIAPEGTKNTNLKFYVIYPKSVLPLDPGLNIQSASTKIVDLDGNDLAGISVNLTNVN